MYCPRCGHQTISDELRFCSYCGFKLGVVKAALAESEETPNTASSDTPALSHQPRQRDINIGVILMFAGTLLASWVAGTTGLGRGRAPGAIVLGIFYLALTLLSGPITKGIHKLLSWEDDVSPSTSQKALGFGSALMFISTVILGMSSLLIYGRVKSTPTFIGVGLAFFLLLFVGRYLMRGLQNILKDESKPAVSKSLGTENQAPRVTTGFDVPSLPAGQGAPVPLFGAHRVTTAEIVAPSSITEHTTSLLDEK
ncbi:MAG: hypothetical protein C5B55_10015 [Blastocatellia bacterium]|nr:MAG: hypothetical protein C5B55_10015 [Blastocatellia bacterium]